MHGKRNSMGKNKGGAQVQVYEKQKPESSYIYLLKDLASESYWMKYLTHVLSKDFRLRLSMFKSYT